MTMEHIIKLNENAQKLRDYANQVQNAKDTATLDQAKLAGLNIYQETLREANRAFMEFNTLAREARARVTQANFEETKKAAVYGEVPVDGPVLTEEQKAELSAHARGLSKAVKKAAKKAKKSKKAE